MKHRIFIIAMAIFVCTAAPGLLFEAARQHGAFFPVIYMRSMKSLNYDLTYNDFYAVFGGRDGQLLCLATDLSSNNAALFILEYKRNHPKVSIIKPLL